jgi:hypothetical protein
MAVTHEEAHGRNVELSAYDLTTRVGLLLLLGLRRARVGRPGSPSH